MQIEFGAPVFGSGGKRLGEVGGLIVDAGTKRARAILVDAGLFDTTKQMVAVSAIVRSDSDGLHLDATTATTSAESPILESEEVAFAQRDEPPTTFLPSAGAGGPVYADTAAVPGDYPDNDSFFEVAPIDPPPVEVESNLGENEVVLGKSTHAISTDDHKLGEVVAFTLGDMGLVDAITVSEGLIFKERSSFSLSDIDEFGTDAVHLRLTRSGAEGR